MEINPQSLDISTLPWLPLDAKSAFPKQSAIYFAIDSLGSIQYIGRSANVRQRWAAHHKFDELQAIGNVRIAYLFMDADLLPSIETALIEWFCPPLNAIYVRPQITRSSKAEMATDKTRISVYLDEELKQDLEKVAKLNKRSLSNLIEVTCQDIVDNARRDRKI